MVMSALPPKADMCAALVYVRFGPKADIGLHPDRVQGLMCESEMPAVRSNDADPIPFA
jgi:hypothetical protein